MIGNSLVEPVLQRHRSYTRRPASLQSFYCQRCGCCYRDVGVTQICSDCRIAAARVGVFGACPCASGQ